MTPTQNSRDFAIVLIERHYETYESIMRMCLSYMSTSDVEDMLKSNDCLEAFLEVYLNEFGMKG